MKSDKERMRFDLKIIASWIEPGAKVLDLGCGEGDLLFYLKENRQAVCTGIERSEERAARCIARGLSVLQGDINEEILDYPDDSFDYVVVSRTLQQVFEPADIIRSLLRIGKRGIVSFPNFSHWRIRMQLLFSGYAPVTKQLPYQWHDTPNIRVITLKDFRRFSKDVGFRILKEEAISTSNHHEGGRIAWFLPDLLATYGIFLIERKV